MNENEKTRAISFEEIKIFLKEQQKTNSALALQRVLNSWQKVDPTLNYLDVQNRMITAEGVNFLVTLVVNSSTRKEFKRALLLYEFSKDTTPEQITRIFGAARAVLAISSVEDVTMEKPISNLSQHRQEIESDFLEETATFLRPVFASEQLILPEPLASEEKMQFIENVLMVLMILENKNKVAQHYYISHLQSLEKYPDALAAIYTFMALTIPIVFDGIVNARKKRGKRTGPSPAQKALNAWFLEKNSGQHVFQKNASQNRALTTYLNYLFKPRECTYGTWIYTYLAAVSALKEKYHL